MALSARQLKVGDTHQEQVVDNLTRTQIVQYAGASGDYNPIHTDEAYTTKVAGYPSVFAHGMLTMGMTGVMLTNYVSLSRREGLCPAPTQSRRRAGGRGLEAYGIKPFTLTLSQREGRRRPPP